jgi:dolichol-phosphate mannosyltransferase
MRELNQFGTIAIIPVYRDNDNMLKVLSKFKEKVVDEICVVADEVSKNGTDRIQKTTCNVPVHIIRNSKRKGIGYAIKQGLRYALDNKKYGIVVVLAGNNKDDPAEIPRLLEPLLKEDCDYVQGSRFLQGGKRVNNPQIRGVFSRLYPIFWTLFTNVRCTDVTNGFRAYKLKLLEDPHINIWQSWLDNYELEYYIHYKALTLGYRTKEVPVSKVYSHRHKGGYSQISPFRDWWKIVGPLIYLKLGVKK